MILVAVGQDDRLQLSQAVPEVGPVGQDEVDAQHLVAGEAQAGVDQQSPAVLLDAGHVLADLAEPAEEDQPDSAAHRRTLV